MHYKTLYCIEILMLNAKVNLRGDQSWFQVSFWYCTALILMLNAPRSTCTCDQSWFQVSFWLSRTTAQGICCGSGGLFLCSRTQFFTCFLKLYCTVLFVLCCAVLYSYCTAYKTLSTSLTERSLDVRHSYPRQQVI